MDIDQPATLDKPQKRSTGRQSKPIDPSQPRIVTYRGKPHIVKRQSPRLSTHDIEAIIALVCKGLNESEACAKMGIDRERYYNWKYIHKSEYDDLFTRLKAEKLNRLVDCVEVATEGDASRGIRADWRAAQWLLSVAAPDRFTKDAGNQQPAQVFSLAVITDLAKRVYGDVVDAQIVAQPPPKAITAPVDDGQQ